MCADHSGPYYILRRAGSQDYVRTDDGETFDVTASRECASSFCVHLAQAVRVFLERATGSRYRMALANRGGPAIPSIDALAAGSLH